MSSINAFESKTRFIARFVPQEWQMGHAVEQEVESPCYFDVTAEVLGMDEFMRADLGEGGNEISDRLRESPSAPEWMRQWPGPFEIYISEHDADSTATAVVEAKKTAKLVGPILPTELREKLVSELVACLIDQLHDQPHVLAQNLRTGWEGLEGITNGKLLQKYRDVSGEDFASAHGITINAFGDIRAT